MRNFLQPLLFTDEEIRGLEEESNLPKVREQKGACIQPSQHHDCTPSSRGAAREHHVHPLAFLEEVSEQVAWRGLWEGKAGRVGEAGRGRLA